MKVLFNGYHLSMNGHTLASKKSLFNSFHLNDHTKVVTTLIIKVKTALNIITRKSQIAVQKFEPPLVV